MHGPCSSILDSSHSFAATPQARLPPGKRAADGTMANAALISSPLTNRGWTHPLTSSCENRAPPTMWTETLEAVTSRFGSSGWGPLVRHSAASSSVLACICGLVFEPEKWALDTTSGAVRTTRTTTSVKNGMVLEPGFRAPKTDLKTDCFLQNRDRCFDPAITLEKHRFECHQQQRDNGRTETEPTPARSDLCSRNRTHGKWIRDMEGDTCLATARPAIRHRPPLHPQSRIPVVRLPVAAA